MTPFTDPGVYTNIKEVRSFHELVTTPFEGEVNALCWERRLPGNFEEVVSVLGVAAGITTLDDERLNALRVSPEGRVAIDILLADQRLLRERDLDPILNCIDGYPR